MKKPNRWLYAVVGVVILLLAGMVYAWSVLSQPIAAFFTDWTKAQLSLTFTICMFSFCLGCMACGSFGSKLKVKYNVWISAVIFLAGFFIASKANTPLVLYIGFGVLGGFASGYVYNAVLGTMSAWFQDKQGLISGILLMGFGLSAFIVGKVYQAVTPAGPGVEAWRTSFMIFGGVLAVVLVICGLFFERPTAEDIKALGVTAVGKKRADNDGIDVDSKEMVKRPSFWFFFCWTICMGFGGMSIIAQASGVATTVGTGVDAGTIATVVGLISIFNGLGRVFFGNLFDKKGRIFTMTVVGIAFAASTGILMAALTTKTFALVVAGFICVGFSYGGLNPSISAFVNSAFGKTNYAMNFSMMNLNLLIASFGGTIAGALIDATGGYMAMMFFMLGCSVLSIVFTQFVRKI